MKNAMKKIMSLVLVAMILVSALPFAASAVTNGVVCDGTATCGHRGDQHVSTCASLAYSCSKLPGCPHTSVFHDPACPLTCDGSATCPHTGCYHKPGCGKACDGTKSCPQYAAGNTAPEYHQAGCLAISKASESISNGVACTNSYECKHVGNNHIAGCPMIPCSNDASCDHGGWNHLETCPFACRNSEACHAWYHLDTCPVKKAAETQPTEPQPTQPEETKPADNVVGEEWMKGIWLYIYTNKNIITPAKYVQLDNYMIVKDHVLNQAEILSVVDDYYKASNANAGILWKGAYMENANIDAINFVDGRDEVPFENLDVARSAHTVIIKVRVDGVTAITTSSNADSSNPKTGDTIMVPFAIMTVSASLLAVAFYMNKKRAF